MTIGTPMMWTLFAAFVLASSKAPRDLSPSLAGKLSTAFQILYVLLVTGSQAGWIPAFFPDFGQWAVLAVTGWSSVDYARRALFRQG